MNADAFRHFFNYHFAENRKIWDTHITSLPHGQFIQPSEYSVGSVRNQIVHLMNVDTVWFGDLSGHAIPDYESSDDNDDRNDIRAHWDRLEQTMRDYLNQLTDDTLLQQPLEGEDKNLYVWQVLLHVVNHGTDHRAQILRALNDLGVRTTYQDYVFYTYGNP